MQQIERADEEAFIGRRVIAFIIDLIIVGILYYLLSLMLGWRNLYTFDPIFPYPLRFGLLLFLYSFIADVLLDSTPGKMIMSLRLDYPDRGALSWVLFREIVKINPYALILDIILSLAFTLKSIRMTDAIFHGGLVRVYPEPIVAQPQRPLYTPQAPPPPLPKREPQPVELPVRTIEGRCPRCGMPFAIGSDGREISGLWNGYCIWCGYPVRERTLGE